MEYRQLGRSGLRVSTLAMGTATFGGAGEFAKWGDSDVDEARTQIDMCLDAGVNLVDTADIYSAGLSEEIVGQAVKGRRDRLLLSTKVRMPTGRGPNEAGLSRHHILRAAEDSLRRLDVEHIDLYHVHEWDGQTPLEETLEALDTLVRSGKVRYLGVSNYAGWQLMKALAVSDAHGYQRFVSNQIYYSLESRDAEYELLPLSVDQGLGVLVWSPLAGGLLTGKYRRDQHEGGGRHTQDWHEPPVRDWDRLYDVVDLLVKVADGHGVPPARVALAYLLTKPAVCSLVLGARRPAQLAETLLAAELELSADEVDLLDRISAPALVYPHWHQAATASDRLGPADQALHRPARRASPGVHR
jgi:aryl-alcohol dehydrogenase-like predicted oxidoreductase